MSMSTTKIKLTNNQKEAINKVKDFVVSQNDIFILTGAAGTGKTTVVKDIIKEVNKYVTEIILLAPTNRAAKILSQKTNIFTETIHAAIYNLEDIKNKDGEIINTRLIPKYLEMDFDKKKTKKLKTQSVLYIIDESSMLSASPNKDGALISDRSLLEDLYSHVKFYNPNNKIIFVGDSYQLPPIGYSGIAPALQKIFLEENFSKKIEEYKLTDILRQDKESPILTLAKSIKEKIDQNQTTYNLIIPNRFKNYNSFIRFFCENYNFKKPGNSIALGWSRKNVLEMNLNIRENLFNKKPNVFEIGDIVYVNTTWQKFPHKISKGEIGIIVGLKDYKGTVEAGILFHEATIEFTGSNGKKHQIQSKVFSDYTYSDIDMLPKEMFVKLAIERSNKNEKFKETKNPKDDQYMNAIQVKFAYALTVHKAQGGEWENVFLHANTNWRDLRWNYTAVTRASKNIYSYLK